jgi:hypothetical protein
VKNLANRLAFLFLITFFIVGCTFTEKNSRVDSSGVIIVICEVFYRPTKSQSLEAAPQIAFTEGDEQMTHEFEDMAVEVRFQDDQFEGRALYIVVTNLDTGSEISRQLYQFGPENPTENQFIGGHGFTGLNYVFHPDSSAEMQYFCSVK